MEQRLCPLLNADHQLLTLQHTAKWSHSIYDLWLGATSHEGCEGTCGHGPLLPAQYGVQLLRDVRHLMVQVPRQLLPHTL